MMGWCRLCRIWTHEEHFLQPTGRREGCGQGRNDIRYHPSNPLCGDVWKLRDGRYMLVDYKDSFCTGVTFSNGERAGMKYTEGFLRYLETEQAELINTWEEWPLRQCGHRGWTRETDKMTTEDSLAFLNNLLKQKGLQPCEQKRRTENV